ncbi:MAG: CHASE3 domain-containing protein [Sphingomonas sp.]|nr:CHASE3 domain-containing protein [Sphingomonas sp.]
MKDWTFGRILAVGYALAGLVLVVVAYVGYQGTASLIENNKNVAHTHEVRRELAMMLTQLVNVETGVRGFAITGQDEYLEPFEAGATGSKAAFDNVRRLTADNPAQQQRLQTLAPLIDARLARSRENIEARRTQGLAGGVAVTSTGTGKEMMDRIRTIVTEMDRTESELLDQRSRSAEASAQFAEGVILWGGLAGVVLVIAIGWFTIVSLTRRIGTAVGLVQSSSAELQAAANQQATSAKEQSSAMNEIATTIRELIATSRQIGDSAQRVAQVADDTNKAARAGDDTVEKANGSISGIRRQTDLIVSHMLDLGKKSQQIGAVLDIVSELAEQTNILAINATIEAAGAGDAGKRFTVVADEIRKLSDRVAGSTKEIRGLIDDVRAAVNTTVMATESGSKAVDGGARHFEEVASSFRQITDMVSTTTEAAKEIELSTKQQTTAVEQVNVATANVAQTTKETEASSGQILQTASELTGLARDLAKLIRSEGRA